MPIFALPKNLAKNVCTTRMSQADSDVPNRGVDLYGLEFYSKDL